MKYPLASSSWESEEYQSILNVLSQDQYKMGQYCKRFETAFSEWVGVKYSVFCNSGSSANLLALSAMKYDPRLSNDDRSEILVPAISWSTTYSPIIQLGFRPVFVDVCKKTFNIDIDDLESKITSRSRAIFSVNILGNPCNYNKIFLICAKHNLYLLEDNCESMGAVYFGKKTGSLGDISTHSTFFSHHISTIEGGVCTTDDELTYEILKSLRAHGWVRDIENKDLFYAYFDKPKNNFYESFHFVLPGYNFRPTEIQGAVGLAQLKRLDAFIENRISNYQFLCAAMLGNEKIKFSLQEEEVGSKSSWFGFGLLFKNEKEKNDAIIKLNENNIECRPIVSGNIQKQPLISKMLMNKKNYLLPNANMIHESGVMIGNHQNPIKDKIIYFIEAIVK